MSEESPKRVKKVGSRSGSARTSPARVIASLQTQALLVSRGVRPAAVEVVQERYLDEARRVAEHHGLLWRADSLATGWTEFWLYRYPHLDRVIDCVPRKPATAYEHWVLGKLFGYSEEAIADFLNGQESSADLDETGPGADRARRHSVGDVVQRDKLAALHALVDTLAGLLSRGRHLLTSSQDPVVAAFYPSLTARPDGQGTLVFRTLLRALQNPRQGGRREHSFSHHRRARPQSDQPLHESRQTQKGREQ
jgi:hypothetical protein